jgi:hypothetical protein
MVKPGQEKAKAPPGPAGQPNGRAGISPNGVQ